MPAPPRLASGTFFALAAGLVWGLIFLAPLLLVSRYLAFGQITLPLAALGRARSAQLSRSDWI